MKIKTLGSKKVKTGISVEALLSVHHLNIKGKEWLHKDSIMFTCLGNGNFGAIYFCAIIRH